MAISFNEELIRVEFVIGEDTVTETVSGQVTIPDIKPGVLRVVDVTAEVTEVETEIEDGGVNIEGYIEPGIIYVGDVDEPPLQPVHFIGGEEARYTFTNFVDIPEAEEGMNVFTDINIRRVSYDIIDERTIEVTVVLSKFVKVTEYRQITVITGVTGIPEENIVQELLRIEDVIGEQTFSSVVTGRIPLPPGKPPIQRILNATADISPVTTEIEDESVIIDAAVEAGVMYVADVEEGPRQPVHFMEGEFNLEEAVEIPGAEEGMTVYANLEVKRVSYDFISPEEVEVDVAILFFIKVTEPKQVNVITDIMDERVEIETELLRVEDVVGEDTVHETITDRLSLPAEKPDIERVLEANARILEDTEVYIETDGVMIEGQYEGSILYVAIAEEGEPAQPVHFAEGIFNFDNFVEIPDAEPGMNAHVEVNVQRVSYEELTTRMVEITVVLRKFVKVTEFRQMEIVTDVVVVSPAAGECPPSYIVYVVQSGDTLWKIARRYNTTVDQLINANPDIDPHNLQIGQKICVPKGIISPKG